MDNPDLDEAEKKHRKEQIVAWREKQRISTIFMIFASLFEIVETLLIMLVLFLLSSLIFFRILDSNNQTVMLVYEISLVFIFVAGFVLGFIVYKKVLGWFIPKFGWDKKLSDDVLSHYLKKSEEEKRAELTK